MVDCLAFINFVNEKMFNSYFQWKDINPDQLMDTKLKCVFENPVSTTTATKTKATTSTSKPDSNSTDGKSKTVGEQIKPSPKVCFYNTDSMITILLFVTFVSFLF